MKLNMPPETLLREIGSVMKQKRQELQLSIVELAELSGVHQDIVLQLEEGLGTELDLATIFPIMTSLKLPPTMIISIFNDTKQQPEQWFSLLIATIPLHEYELTASIAAQLLESPNLYNIFNVKRLYDMITTTSWDDRLQLCLYETIIQYCTTHHIRIFIAKSLLQQYLIKCKDDTQLDIAFEFGQQVLEHVKSLSAPEKILLYAKMSIHAFKRLQFNDCIALCSHVINSKEKNELHQMEAIYAACRSFYFLGKYKFAKRFLHMYNTSSSPDAEQNKNIMTAMLYGKTGQTKTAIIELETCLATTSPSNYVHLATELLELYLKQNDLQAAADLIQDEDRIMEYPISSPLQDYRTAHFHKLKGDFFIRKKMAREAVPAYIYSSLHYSKINMYGKVFEIVNMTMKYMIEFKLVEDPKEKAKQPPPPPHMCFPSPEW
ncbi:helix-turn-helix domain-containing protein [Paenibacillus sp. 481]|uniref:helix-turn-helix domain-containing protein n=1 Tax=Paenibacillus sp. 481 TaxID=2835869 RepID=UPI001E5C24BE|nr:helix-turn-helix domain-containing protein [Paenibacillus sp. 481]UHA75071.1 helix-turn-helix domain-containing protein [Paenibacillus sp. 481]